MKKTIEEHILEIKKSEPISQRQLWYKGSIKNFNVYEVDPNLLKFNYLNGRIGTEVMEHEGLDGHNISNKSVDELNDLIEQFIWDKTPGPNKDTKKNISERGQLEPGVITRDGIIVDGNRRFMCIRKLNKEGKNLPFKTIILDDTYEDGGAKEQQIKILETQIQLGTDEKLGYSPLEKYWRIIDFIDKYIDVTSPTMSIDGLVEIFKAKKPSEIRQNYGIGKMMQEYLVYIGAPNIYSRLKNTEDLFINLYKNYQLYSKGKGKVGWHVEEFDLDEYKDFGFNLIRYIYNVDKKHTVEWNPKKVRELFFVDSKEKAIFTNKNIWEEARDSNMDNISSVDYSVDDFMEDCNNNLSLAAAKADRVWADKVSPNFRGILSKAKNRLENKALINKPEQLIEEAFRKLSSLIDEDRFKNNKEVEFEDGVLRSLERHTAKNFEYVNSIRKIAEALKKNLQP